MDHSEIVETLLGYGDGLSRVMQATGLEVEEIEEIALNYNVEACPDCSWYCESGELIHPDTGEEDGHCENCRM